MIDAPSGINGSAFCMVKSRPLTLTLKIESKSFSVSFTSGVIAVIPAFAKTISSLPFSRLIWEKSRSKSPRLATSPWTPITFLPKASPESAARAILDGLARGDEEIFPDPMSGTIAEGWRSSAVKALQRQFAAYVQETPVKS